MHAARILRLNFRHTSKRTQTHTHTHRHKIPSHFIYNEFVCLQMHTIRNGVLRFTILYFRSRKSAFSSLVPFVFSALQINFNLTHFQRSYFIMPFGLIQNANARSLLLRVHLTSSHLRHNIHNENIYDYFFFFQRVCTFLSWALKWLMKKVWKYKTFSYFPVDKFCDWILYHAFINCFSQNDGSLREN